MNKIVKILSLYKTHTLEILFVFFAINFLINMSSTSLLPVIILITGIEIKREIKKERNYYV